MWKKIVYPLIALGIASNVFVAFVRLHEGDYWWAGDDIAQAMVLVMAWALLELNDRQDRFIRLLVDNPCTCCSKSRPDRTPPRSATDHQPAKETH